MFGHLGFEIETIWDKRTQDLLSTNPSEDDSETASAVTPPRKGRSDDNALTPGTEAETPEAVAPPRISLSTNRADSLPFPRELLFGDDEEEQQTPLTKEEPAFGLEKTLRSIPPLGYALLAILVTLTARSSLSSMEQPEDVSDTIVDIVVDSDDPLAASVSDFFQGLVIRDDGSSRIQVLHPKVILALPVVVIHSIQSFFRFLIGAATPNIAAGRSNNGPGVRGGGDRQTETRVQTRSDGESKTPESPEGDNDRRFRPRGFFRRLGRPKQVVESS